MFEDTLVEEDIHPNYVSAGITETGRVRATNQDAFVERGAQNLWTVADGMGGHRDGDVASRMVCDSLKTFKAPRAFEHAIDDLRQRMSDVNSRLYAAAIRPVNPVQSGSTVVMFYVQRTACAILWAGDSRVYRLRQRKLVQLTTDHTWASELQLDGTAIEEIDHAITRAVGGEATLTLDVRRDRVRLGDRYLLCSDGLTRELTAERIGALLSQGDVAQSARALVDAALANGGHDNITVIVIEAT